jgi:hypothetical protein
MTLYQHLKELTNKLNKMGIKAVGTPKGKRLLEQLNQGITKLLTLPPPMEEQRVQEEHTRAKHREEQRVIDDTPIMTIPRITNAPAIMQTRNPTAKRALKNTPRLHRQETRNNTPGIAHVPALIEPILPLFQNVRFVEDDPPRRSKWNTQQSKGPQTYTNIPSGV